MKTNLKRTNSTLAAVLRAAANGVIETRAQTARGLLRHLQANPGDIPKVFRASRVPREELLARFLNGRELDRASLGAVHLVEVQKSFPARSYRVVALYDAVEAAEAKRRAMRAHPRKRNVESGPAHTDLTTGFLWWERKFEYRGAYRGWYGTYLVPSYLSAAYLTPRMVKLVQWSKSPGGPAVVCRRRAPATLAWDTDGLGLCLVARDGTDLHVNAQDLRRRDFARWACGELKNKRNELAPQRQRQRREAQIGSFLSDATADWPVSLADSLAAGNCREGSIAFAVRHLGISREQAETTLISARKIIANGDPRARNAAKTALCRLLDAGGRPHRHSSV